METEEKYNDFLISSFIINFDTPKHNIFKENSDFILNDILT